MSRTSTKKESARKATERKKTKKELEYSVSLLRATLESTADGILVVDTEGKIVSFNQKFVEMWHIPVPVLASHRDDEALAFVLNQLKAPDAFLEKVRELYLQPEAESFDVLDFKDGRVFERYSQPQRMAGKSVGRVWSFRDITLRRRAEEDVRFKSLLLDNASDSIFALNQQGTIIYVNETACQERGFTKEELIGKPADQVESPEYSNLFRQRIGELLATGRIKAETAHVRRDGALIDVEINGRVLELGGGQVLVGIGRDITDRKRAERALEQAVSLLRATLESTADGILVVDTEGKIVGFNQKFVEMWRIPGSVIASHSDDEALAFVLDQLKNPDAFLGKVRGLYSQPDAQSFDVLDFKDGRVFERYSQPQRIAGKSVGRVWSFRDVTARRREEEDLRFKSLLLDNATDSIFVLNQQGTIIYVNEAACVDRGFTREELIGTRIDQIEAPGYKDVVPRNLESLLQTGSLRIETQQVRKDGTLLDCEVSAKVVDFAGEEVFLGVLRDIGERKRAEETLEQAVSLLRATLESTADGILVVDTERQIVGVNRKFAEMWRVPGSVIASRSADEVLAFVLNQLKAPDDFLGKVKALYSQPDAESYDVLDFKDGRVFEQYSQPQRIGGESVGRVWSFRDVTARRRAEEDLEFKSVLLDKATDSVFVLNQQGTIIYVNEAAYKDRGFTKEELLGKPIDQVDAPHYKEAVRQNMRRLLETGSIRVETQHLNKDGTLMDVEVNAQVVEWAGSTVIVGILRDIGERKRAEAALRFIAEGTASLTGDEFFQSLVRHLASALRVRYAFVAERIGPFKDKVVTLALWAGNSLSDNVTYDLDGTPCGNVATGETCFYRQNVQALFPTFTMLADLRVESYLGVPFFDSSGRATGHVAVMHDKPMTNAEASAKAIVKIFAARVGAELERRQKEDQVRHMAYHDQLTDLPNRALFYDRLRQAILVGSRDNKPVAVLFLDLDHFKDINDAFGHFFGDQLLRQVALCIQRVLRKSDTVARMGGDEFAVLLPGTDIDSAVSIAQKILEAVVMFCDIDGKATRVGASIGIVLYPDHGEESDLLIQLADRAMYAAKQSGKGYAVHTIDPTPNAAA